MSWQKLRQLTIHVFTVCAILSNLIMFLLIHKHSPKRLGSYKYLMISMAFFGLFYAILDMFLMTDHFSKGSGYMIFIDVQQLPLPDAVLPLCHRKFLSILPETRALFSVTYWASYGTSLGIFGVHFIFRYLVLSGNTNWTSGNSPKFAVWLTTPLVFGLIHSFSTWYFIGPSEVTRQFMEEEVLAGTNRSSEEFHFLGPYFRPKGADGEEYLNWMAIEGITPISILIIISCSVMLFFGGKCHLEIRKLVVKSSRSAQFRAVEIQLFSALVLQTIIPLFLMHIPCTIIIAFCLLNSACETLGRVFCITIALFPALDPLPNMLVIDSYRKALWSKFRFSVSK